jgi:hypothetical protein
VDAAAGLRAEHVPQVVVEEPFRERSAPFEFPPDAG